MRPLVGEQGEITLDVVPQVVLPDPALTAVLRETTGTDQATTALDTRALKTSARVEDGQALIVGGLVTRARSQDDQGPPGLRDLPLVGWLFGETARRDEETELVIVLSPTIVRDPIPAANLWAFPDPLAGLVEPVGP